MKWKVYNRYLAREKAKKWQESLADDLLWKPDQIIENELAYEYLEIRKSLIEKYNEIFPKDCNRKDYERNRDFGIHLYSLLTQEFKMTLSDAANSDVWNYLTFCVIPDIVFDRWDNQVNDDRFWANSKRLWPKCLWWMVHLSLQDGDIEKTRNVLSESFDISQLVERGGTEGYRIAVFRKIMYYYAQIPKEQRGRTAEGKGSSLSRILQRDIVRSSLIEPELYAGGVDEYVKDLFRYFGWLREEERT